MKKALPFIIAALVLIAVAVIIVIVVNKNNNSNADPKETEGVVSTSKPFDPYQDYPISKEGFADLASGDVNKDGETTDWDSILFERYLSNWDVQIYLDECDIDGDGEVSDWDSMMFTRYLCGWDVDLPTAVPKSSPSPTN